MSKFRSLILVLALVCTGSGVFAQQQNPNPDAANKTETKPGVKEDKPVSTETKAAKKDDELARVAVLPFNDRTKTKNFQYMSVSLSEAISTSMLKNFSYNRISENDIKNASYEADQYLRKSKIEKVSKKTAADKNKKGDESGKRIKTEEELQLDEDQLKFAKRIAQNLKSDIVIYGYYNYDNETNELVFNAAIYLVAADSVKLLDETKNVVDVTLFKATDKVAKNLVDTITVMIEDADKTAGTKKALAEGEKENKAGEKKALTKKVGAPPVLDWAAKKIAINLMVGTSLIPAARTENAKPTVYDVNNQYLDIRFWPIKSFQLSLRFGHLGLESQNTFAHYNLNTLDLMLFGGYGIYTEKRLYTYAELGAGYYLGSLEVWKNNPGSNSSIQGKYKIQNPVYAARIGTDLLLTSFLSAGISSTFQIMYDRPNPILHLNLMFNLGVVF